MSQTPKSSKPRPKVPHSLKLVAIVGMVLAGAYLIADHPYAQRFAKANNEMERIRHNVVEPLGGVELSGGGYKPTTNGSYDLFRFTGFCGFDLHCPYIARSWFVPVEPGQEQAVEESMVKQSGYQHTGSTEQSCSLSVSNFCSIMADNGALSMSVTIRANSASQPPSRAVGSKVWRAVSVSVSLE